MCIPINFHAEQTITIGTPSDELEISEHLIELADKLQIIAIMLDMLLNQKLIEVL